MQIFIIQRILAVLLMLFSFTFLPPAVIGSLYGDENAYAFVEAFSMVFVAGLIFWLPVRKIRRELRTREGFLVVVLFWLVLGFSGSVPLWLALSPELSWTDAVFESLSGLTTTGATVLVGLDNMPISVLFYRQELQWLGGMGIIVLAVAIVPMLGIGGMQLYRAETPGPMKDSKLTPRITETAKALWYIYLALTIACALAYWSAGMDVFDAITHSFSTVAIGGFSTHDASMGYFNSPLIEMIAVFFMVLAGANFALHFLVWRRKDLLVYWRDSEFKAYLLYLVIGVFLTLVYLIYSEHFESWVDAIHHGIFQTVSIATTTGFTTSGYHLWPGFLPVLLLFMSFIGGCAGSTGGGMKVIRFLLLWKQGHRELRRLIHPNAQIAVKIGKKPLPDRVIEAVWGFFAAYVAVFALMMLLLMASGLDQVTAFSAVAATINNLGPGLGEVAKNYASINDFAKWVLSFAMILGRLEVFTLLVVLMPEFWRR